MNASLMWISFLEINFLHVQCAIISIKYSLNILMFGKLAIFTKFRIFHLFITFENMYTYTELKSKYRIGSSTEFINMHHRIYQTLVAPNLNEFLSNFYSEIFPPSVKMSVIRTTFFERAVAKMKCHIVTDRKVRGMNSF